MWTAVNVFGDLNRFNVKGLYKGHLPPRVGLLQETKARKNMRNNERNTDNEKLVKYPNN